MCRPAVLPSSDTFPHRIDVPVEAFSNSNIQPICMYSSDGARKSHVRYSCCPVSRPGHPARKQKCDVIAPMIPTLSLVAKRPHTIMEQRILCRGTALPPVLSLRLLIGYGRKYRGIHDTPESVREAQPTRQCGKKNNRATDHQRSGRPICTPHQNKYNRQCRTNPRKSARRGPQQRWRRNKNEQSSIQSKVAVIRIREYPR